MSARIFTLFLIAFIATAPGFDRARAGTWDYGLEAAGRSYPLGAYVAGETGYGQKIWRKGDSRVWYGYLRPSARLASSATVNEGSLAVDVYPVSFAGLTAGRTWSHRNSENESLDCDRIACLGGLENWFLNARLALGAGRWFASIVWDRFQYLPTTKDKPVAEPELMLALAPTGDRADRWTALSGLSWNERWRAGLLAQGTDLRGSAGHQEMQLLFARRAQAPWTYFAGIGRFASTEAAPSLTLIGSISWTGAERLGF